MMKRKKRRKRKKRWRKTRNMIEEKLGKSVFRLKSRLSYDLHPSRGGYVGTRVSPRLRTRRGGRKKGSAKRGKKEGKGEAIHQEGVLSEQEYCQG